MLIKKTKSQDIENLLNTFVFDNILKNSKRKRGFASMSQTKRSAIAGKGGIAADKKGTAHTWTSEEARKAGSKGGEHKRNTKNS